MKINTPGIACNLTLLAGLALFGAPGCSAEEGRDGTELDDEQVEFRYVGPSTTDYAPVLRIENSGGFRCTATAISDDVILTAMHCLKDPDESQWATWVKVRVAHGNNSDAVGQRSSYAILEAAAWDDIDSVPDGDIALVKFADGTFSEYYPTSPTPARGETSGSPTFVGFGGNDTKSYNSSVGGFTGIPNDSPTFTANGDFEFGDSGGPLLLDDGSGGYQAVGVLSGFSGQFAAVNSPVASLLDTVATEIEDQCVEIWKDINEQGQGYSFCLTSRIRDAAPSYTMAQFHGTGSQAYAQLVEEASSVMIPPGSAVTLWDHSGNTGDFRTFQNIFGFGDTEFVNLTDYGFNDKMGGVQVEWDEYGSGIDWTIRSRVDDGACIDSGALLSDCNGTVDQKFTLKPQAGGGYLVQSKATSNCLDSSGGSLSATHCSSGSNSQVWYFKNNRWTSGDPQDFLFGTSIIGKRMLSCMYAGNLGALGTRFCDSNVSSSTAEMFYLDMR